MKLSYKIITVLLFCTGQLFTSCKKFVEIPPPDTAVTGSSVFTDDKTALAALNGIYSRMSDISTFISGVTGVALLTGLSADEFDNQSDKTELIEFFNNSLLSNNVILPNLWSEPYKHIYGANAILEGLQKSNGLSAEVSARLEGEAKFIRALYYFYLINYFGDVPLQLSTDYAINALMPRTPKSDVYTQIIADLKDAESLLLDTYPTSNRTHPNKAAALSLLARVYLFTGAWSEAEAAATTVIDDSRYVLNDDLSKVFLNNSEEAIWQLRPSQPWYGTYEVDALQVSPYYGPTVSIGNSLLNAFEPGDQRKDKWVLAVPYNSIIYYQPYKYHQQYTAAADAIPDEFQVVFRIAELYLIRGEARIHQGKLTGAESAESDINEIRHRAGLLNTTASTELDLTAALIQEKRVELFSEMGIRWFDLKRWNIADDVLGSVKPSWQEGDALYPLPLHEIMSNPKLTQNVGYD